MGSGWSIRLAGLAAIACATVVAVSLREALQPVNLAMIYLLVVVAFAVRADRTTATLVSLGSAAAFDFYCIPPYNTFAVQDTEYLLTFVALFTAGLVISSQTERIRAHGREAAAREARTQTLYRLSEGLANETRVFELVRVAAALASEALGTSVVIFLRDGGSISFDRRTSDHLPVPAGDLPLAKTAFEQGRKTSGSALYVPLRGTRDAVGVMAVVTGPSPFAEAERDLLIDLVAHHIALAVERTSSQNTAERSRVQMETEQMRSSLLSAVSHDLLTPLASITGAASAVREQAEKLSRETRDELLQSICDEAERLSRLVRNLLDMTRFASGEVELRREPCPLEEIVELALHRLEGVLKGRVVRVEIPANLPLIHGDEVLLGQVLVNLLENAAKYTPPGSAIEIHGRDAGGAVEVTVRDHGPGIAAGQEERLFEKFYRGKSGSTNGTGLGLAIAKAVVEAHGGGIEAHNHKQGGAEFSLRLPAFSMSKEHLA